MGSAVPSALGELAAGASAAEAVAAVALPLAVATIVLWWFRLRRRDEEFVGITPGEIPAPTRTVGTARVRGGEWDGPLAPRFTRPDGVPPGLAGTVIDGVADVRDLTATLIDLAVRREVDITPADTESDEAGPMKRGDDWRITRTAGGDEPGPHALSPHERAALTAFLGGGSTVLLCQLRSADFAMALRAAQVEFYREVVDRGWYRRHPRSRNNVLATFGLLLLLGAVIGAVVAAVRWDGGREALWIPTLAVGVGLGAVAMVRLGRGRTPRTALGTAVRIQSLGFRKYLATAEADQLNWEEARRIFPTFLPYAVAFGVAEHWSAAVGSVARSAALHEAGENAVGLALDLASDPGSIQLLGNLVDLVPDDLPDLTALTDLPDLGLGDIDLPDLDLPDLDLGDLLSGVGDAVGSFAGSIGDLADADGCLDGCGCLFDW